MPELPDVEAVRRHLISQGLVGRRITGADLLLPKAVRVPSPTQFQADVAGRRFEEIGRRAKFLVFDLDGRPGLTLILHLRMTGSLKLTRAGDDRPHHTRNVFTLDSGGELCFVDPRKLGTMSLVADAADVLAGLGPEPLDAGFTPKVLAHQLSRRTAPVKALLCDQAVVAGIGNIYADEVLFLARIGPLRPGRDLSARDNRRLHEAIVGRLSEAVEQMAPLASAEGPPTESTEGLEALLVPRSEGAPCSRCGASIARVVVRGRSSYYCRRCQKK